MYTDALYIQRGRSPQHMHIHIHIHEPIFTWFRLNYEGVEQMLKSPSQNVKKAHTFSAIYLFRAEIITTVAIF